MSKAIRLTPIGRMLVRWVGFGTLVIAMFLLSAGLNRALLALLQPGDGRTGGGELNPLEEQPHLGTLENTDVMNVVVKSAHNGAHFRINNELIFATKKSQRGIAVVVVNMQSGKVTSAKVFDTFLRGGSEALETFLTGIHEDRMVLFAVKDEGSHSLTDVVKDIIQSQFGSTRIHDLDYLDTWAFIAFQGSVQPDRLSPTGALSNTDTLEQHLEVLSKGRDFDSPGELAKATVSVRLLSKEHHIYCAGWKEEKAEDGISSLTEQRRQFCISYEGYGALCRCRDPLPVRFPARPMPQISRPNWPWTLAEEADEQQTLFNHIAGMDPSYRSHGLLHRAHSDDDFDGLTREATEALYKHSTEAVRALIGDAQFLASIPVAVIASNRPQYLHRTLSALLRADGVTRTSINVYVDGDHPEVSDVCNLLGIFHRNFQARGSRSGRIANHYKNSLTHAFEHFIDARYLFVMEEDLEVSPDVFTYFAQLVPVLEVDPSLYCISAWNDHGFPQSSHDPALVYRTDYMPGLGWLLKRELFETELGLKWPIPEKRWDWDMWMRNPRIRQGRECLYPDVSRTFHFGASGVNVNNYFQNAYFLGRKKNEERGVQLHDPSRLLKRNYEEDLQHLVSHARVLDHSKDPCDPDFVPTDVQGQDFVFVYEMNTRRDPDHFLQACRCFGIWDLDVRATHRGLSRFWYNGNRIFAIGRYSPYWMFVPEFVEPINVRNHKRPGGPTVVGKLKEVMKQEEEQAKERLKVRKREWQLAHGIVPEDDDDDNAAPM
eukprot:Clim_evm2s61 gene=Clim_evmTU2s61